MGYGSVGYHLVSYAVRPSFHVGADRPANYRNLPSDVIARQSTSTRGVVFTGALQYTLPTSIRISASAASTTPYLISARFHSISLHIVIIIMEIAVVGDSYVRRLGDYTQLLGRKNLNLPDICSSCTFFGRGGASLYGRKPVREILKIALQIGPRGLYLNIGSNDLCNKGIDPATLARDIIHLAEEAMQSCEDMFIIIGQISKRAAPPDELYNDRVTRCNTELIKLVKQVRCRRLTFGVIRGLCQPKQEDFEDGIHYSKTGSIKFYKGIRGAFIRAEKMRADKDFPDWLPRIRGIVLVNYLNLITFRILSIMIQNIYIKAIKQTYIFR